MQGLEEVIKGRFYNIKFWKKVSFLRRVLGWLERFPKPCLNPTNLHFSLAPGVQS